MYVSLKEAVNLLASFFTSPCVEELVVSSKQKKSVSTGAIVEFAETSHTTNRNGWFSRRTPLQTNAMVAMNKGECSTVALFSQCWSSTVTSMKRKKY